MLNIKSICVTTFAFALTSIAIGISQAKTSDWMAPNHGFKISAETPTRIPQKSGAVAKISGEVTLTGSNGIGNGTGGGQDHKDSTLLDVMQGDGVELHFYFPDMTTEVTSQVTLNASANKLAYSYQTPALQATNLNTLIAVVSHVSPDIRALQSVKSKLDQRILALTTLVKKFGVRKDIEAKDLALLKNLNDRVRAISSRIDQKLSKDSQILAEMRFPLQVDNLVSQSSLNSTVSNHFRYQVSYASGSAIEGEKTTVTGQVRRLGNKDDNDEDDSSDQWLARFAWNGTQVKSIGPVSLGLGESITYSYTTPALNPQLENSFSITLNAVDDTGKTGKQFGSIAFIEPVAPDTTAPTWLAGATPQVGTCLQTMQPVSINVLDSFGLMDPNSFEATLTGQLINGSTSTKDVSSLLALSTPDQGQNYSVAADLNPLAEGKYTFSIQSTDLAGNGAQPDPFTSIFRINRTPPVVTLAVADSIYTNKPYTNKPNFSFSSTTFDYFDLCQVSTTAVLNGQSIAQTSSPNLTVNGTFTEGPNTVEVRSANISDGLNAEPKSFSAILDTVPATLSNLSPAANQVVITLSFQVSGQSDEPLLFARVNGQDLTLSSDKKSFSGTYTVPTEGAYTLHFETADLATNVTAKDVPIQVTLHVLNPALLSVSPDPDGAHLIVQGAPGATRPGAKVTASSNFFNSGSTTSAFNGSFSIQLNAFTQATVTATDPTNGKSESAKVTFGSNGGTLLSGSVRDTDNLPLAGATVRISGTSLTTKTDGSGVFAFSQPVTGDRVLIIDGSTVTVDPTKPARKFSSTHIAINIGISQSNVLKRPIYLAPIPLDGSSQIVDASEGGTVTNASAPGVALSIPAGSATFPDGNTESAISMATISSEVATIPPMNFARPKNVVALEPSGTTFSEPVDLELPNVNELPPGVETVILSMNSQKGIWEIDGIAKVSDDGHSIRTKPGMGLTHFSMVYATPVAPTVRQIGSQDMPGADTFNGALSTSINMPSLKSLGQDVTPSLIYKSAWAKPTTLITNMFDIPNTKIDYDSGTIQGDHLVIKKCFLFICETADINFYSKVKATGTAAYQPKKITAQFFSTGITSPAIDFVGVPNQSVISYAIDLKDGNTGEYLPSGLYPYQAHYETHLTELDIGTRTITAWTNLSGPEISQQTFTETRDIEQAFPSDLGGPLFVQNEINSPAGRGWKISGVQKIANPTANRVMIEEADGSTSSYSISNTITTLANVSNSFDLTLGADVSSWPKMAAVRASDRAIVTGDLSSQNIPGTFKASGGMFGIGGTLAGFHYDIWPGDETTCHCQRELASYSYPSTPSALLTLPDGRIVGTDNGRSIIFTGSAGSSISVLAGTFTSAPSYAQDYGFSSNISNFCNSTGASCNVYLYQDQWTHDADCGSALYSSGSVPYATFNGDGGLGAALNHPMGISAGPRANTLVVADTGNNRVRVIDLQNNTTTTVAGNGQNYDSGSHIPATQASIFHPRSAIYDSIGNLYITSENGYIWKVDTTGQITPIVLPANSIFADSIPAMNAALSRPYGMAIDNQNGYLYVADTGHHRVIRIDFQTMTANTVAGNGTPSYTGDNIPALGSGLNNPTFLGLDPSGNLLIVDSGNQRIRRVSFENTSNGVLAFAPTAQDNSTLIRNSDGTFTRKYRNGTAVSFDASGREVSTLDRLGRQTVYSYDDQGRLTLVTLPTLQKIQYFYSGNHLRQIVDAANRSTSFTYDGMNNLVQVTFPDGSSKAYSYDPSGLMTAETDQRGNAIQYSYNQYNRLAKVTRPDLSEIRVADSGSATAANDISQGSTKQLQSYGSAPGQAFDGIQDARSVTTRFSKNFMGYVTNIVDGNGNTTTVERDTLGYPTLITRPDGTTVTFAYDPATHDLLSQTDTASGATTSQTYDAFGNILTQTSARGYTSSRVYDPITGLLLSTRNPQNHGLAYSYNSMGLPLTITNSLGQKTIFTYDSQGNKLTSTDGAGHITTFSYDLAGNVVSTIDANGNTTSFAYDTFNRMIATTTPKGEQTQYSYLPDGHLSSIIDPLGNITKFDYNELGQPIKRTDPLGMIVTKSYDSNGNLIQEIDPNGNVKTFAYDNLNRLIRKILPDDVYAFTYDVKGNLKTAENAVSRIELTYDSTNKPISTTTSGQGALSSMPAVTLSFVRDGNGNRTQLVDPTGTTTYEFDSTDKLSSLTSPEGETYEFNFDAANRLTSLARPGSATNLSFDNASYISGIRHLSGGVPILTYDYQRDNIGNITQISALTGTKNLAYDANSQLVSATNPEASGDFKNEAFGYDAAANRTSNQSGTYSYDNKSQRLVQDYKYQYFYDDNGNLVKKVSKTDLSDVTNFSYTSENQLVAFKVYQAGSNNPVKEVRYYYDALGRRIQKQVIDHSAESDQQKTFTRRYVYDGNEVLIEYNENNQILAHYTHSTLASDDVLGVSVTSSGVDAKMAHQPGSYFYLKDSSGTIVDVTDSNGTKLQHYIYSIFGEILGIQNAQGQDITANAALNTTYTYNGREFDPESGYYYYRARYYDANIGRFLQKDPSPGMLSIAGTVINSWVYVLNNPANLLDPHGQNFWTGLGLMIAGIAVAVTGAVLTATGAGAPIGIGLASLSAGLISASFTSFGGGSSSAVLRSFVVGAVVGALAGGAGYGLGELGEAIGGVVGKAVGSFIGAGVATYGAARAMGASNTTAIISGLIGGTSGAIGAFDGPSLNPGVPDLPAAAAPAVGAGAATAPVIADPGTIMIPSFK